MQKTQTSLGSAAAKDKNRSADMCVKATTSPMNHPEVLGKAVLRTTAALGIDPARFAKVLGISISSISRLSRETYS